MEENLGAASIDPQIEQIDNSRESIFNKISNQFLLLLLLLLSVGFGLLFY
jgi:hypothetical protein